MGEPGARSQEQLQHQSWDYMKFWWVHDGIPISRRILQWKIMGLEGVPPSPAYQPPDHENIWSKIKGLLGFMIPCRKAKTKGLVAPRQGGIGGCIFDKAAVSGRLGAHKHTHIQKISNRTVLELTPKNMSI